MSGLVLMLPVLMVQANPAEPAPTDRPVFDILDYRIDGNTVLDVETVEQAVYPHLGPGKGIEDVEQARVALETAYRDHGYPTVVIDIPEQDVNNGQVRLKVVEGRVAFVQVTGSRYYALGKIRAGLNVGGTSVVGTGSIYGLRLVKPLPAKTGWLHNLTAGFDYKQFDQAVTLAGQDTGSTPIRYALFLLGYDASLRLGDSLTSLNAAGHFSIRGLGNDPTEFERRRYQARADFFYFTADVKHQQPLPADFLLSTRLSGQISGQPLISNEQFSVGGVQSVRGYHQTQQLGDNGLNASLELYGPRLWAGRLLGFYDWATLWIENPLAANPARYTLASAGLGLRMQILRHFQGELDWGYPFYRQGTVDTGQQRLDFRVSYEF